MNKKQFFISTIIASILGGVIAIGGYKLLSNDTPKVHQHESIEAQQQYELTGFSDIDADIPTSLNFKQAAKATTPAVVHVKMYKEVTHARNNIFPEDELLREFFGDRYRQPAPQPRSEGPQHAGSGSGVILTSTGYIATNNHVVEGASKVEVVLFDKRQYIAEVVGTDPTTDLALLKIESESALPFIPYANSDQLEVGDWVLAVGNPFDLTSTVTAGIVSAKARNINILHDKENLAIESFIQTDAAVNPGNSGGALVTPSGKLVGINTAIATPTGTYAGYSFAVPSNLVKKVMNDLKDYGQVQRALLGVSIREITAELKDEKQLSSMNGIYIAEVREGSAAGEADLKEGDIIVKINDVDVNSPSELQEAVALYRPGDKVNVTYLRNGSKNTVEITLRNKLGNTDIVKKEDTMTITTLGAKMRGLNPEEMQKYGIDYGVKVILLEDGKLKDAGLRNGDVITKINYMKVESPDHVMGMLKHKKDGALIEVINNKGEKVFLGFGW